MYSFLVHGRLSSSFLCCALSAEGGDGFVKNGVDVRFCKVYFGEYDHNSENEGKYRIMSTENPSGKTSPCWIIPSPKIRCLKWFSVPNKVYLTKFPPTALYQSPREQKSSRTFKKRFSPSPHARNVMFHDSQEFLLIVSDLIYIMLDVLVLHNIEKCTYWYNTQKV